VKLLVGWDGSHASDEAIAAVTGRRWPVGSQATLLTALDVPTSMAILSLIGGNGGTGGDERLIVARVDEAARRLHESGLRVTTVIKEGKPRSELLQESERGGVDCIFMGARGLSRIEWVLLGSVSATVAARAQCSVEVVRRAR
jgi:nucleotide-binding universal stress UspA family protein